MAIDREAITTVAMQGYTHPADCTGLSDAYDSWRDQAVAPRAIGRPATWTAPTRCSTRPATPGPTGRGRCPTARRSRSTSRSASTSSDWLSVANIISQNLADVGVKAKVNSPDWSAVVAGYEDGSFDTGIVWSNMAPTPYQFYRGVMSTETVKPVGEQAIQNYHRFGVQEADTLLGEFAAATDEASQRQAMDELQEVFAENAPIVRCSPGPGGARTTRRDSPVSRRGQPVRDRCRPGRPTTVLVLTTLEPRAGRPRRFSRSCNPRLSRCPAQAPRARRTTQRSEYDALRLQRLGFYLVAFWVWVTLNFLLPRFMPGDPISG